MSCSIRKLTPSVAREAVLAGLHLCNSSLGPSAGPHTTSTPPSAPPRPSHQQGLNQATVELADVAVEVPRLREAALTPAASVRLLACVHHGVAAQVVRILEALAALHTRVQNRRASQVALMLKNLLGQCRRCRRYGFNPWVGRSP